MNAQRVIRGPGPDVDDTQFWERIRADAKDKASATEGGRLIPWPTEPMFLLDRRT
jgi:hypothetical protein